MSEIPLVLAQRIEVPEWVQVRGRLLRGGGVRMGQVGLEGARGLEGGAAGATEGLCVAGPLGIPLGLVQWKRASSRRQAGTSGFLSVSDSDPPTSGWRWGAENIQGKRRELGERMERQRPRCLRERRVAGLRLEKERGRAGFVQQ